MISFSRSLMIAAAALGAGDHAVDRLVQLGHADRLLVAPRGEDRGLVDQVLRDRRRRSRASARQRLGVDGLVERLALGVDVEDRLAALDVRAVEHHLPVEAAGAQQRRVEHVGAVRRGDDDHVGVRVEAVHLDEDLVQGLLALVVRAAEARAALATDRVDLVDEDDAGRVALGLLEEVAHAGRTDADEHLDELRAGDAEERHASLTGHGPREQRLAGAGRADQQHAARDAGAERRELLRVLQELDDLGQLLLRLVDARHVGEGHDGLVADEHARAALAEAHRLVVGALGLPHHEEDEAADEEHRQQRGDEQREDAARRTRLDVVVGEATAVGAGDLADLGAVVDVRGGDRGGPLLRLAGELDGERGAFLGDRLDAPGGGVLEELAVRVRLAGAVVAHERPEDRQSEDGEDDEHDAVANDAAGQRGSTFASVRSAAG